MATPSTAEKLDAPQKLHIPQEIADLIYEAFRNKHEALTLCLVCRTFAESLRPRIIEIYEDPYQSFGSGPYGFHKRDFVLYIDEAGIGGIEALAHPTFANHVRHVVLADRCLVDKYLEHRIDCRPGQWIKSGPVPTEWYTSNPRRPYKSHKYGASPSVYQLPRDPATERPEIILRHELGDNDEHWLAKYSRLPFEHLIPTRTSDKMTNIVFDFELKERKHVDYLHFDLRSSPTLLSRLSKALSTFVNLESIRTSPRNVIVIHHSKPYNDLKKWTEASSLPASELSLGYAHHIVWPALHDFAAIMSPQISDSTPNLRSHNSGPRSDSYGNNVYPRRVHSTQNITLLAKLAASCQHLQTLCLRPGEIGDSLVDEVIAFEIRHFLRCLAATTKRLSLQYLKIHQAEPTSQDLLTILDRHQATLKEVQLLKSQNTNKYEAWLALFVSTTDMPKLKLFKIDLAPEWFKDDALHFDGPGAEGLWVENANLADKKLSLLILQELRERKRSNHSDLVYRPEDV